MTSIMDMVQDRKGVHVLDPGAQVSFRDQNDNEVTVTCTEVNPLASEGQISSTARTYQFSYTDADGRRKTKNIEYVGFNNFHDDSFGEEEEKKRKGRLINNAINHLKAKNALEGGVMTNCSSGQNRAALANAAIMMENAISKKLDELLQDAGSIVEQQRIINDFERHLDTPINPRSNYTERDLLADSARGLIDANVVMESRQRDTLHAIALEVQNDVLGKRREAILGRAVSSMAAARTASSAISRAPSSHVARSTMHTTSIDPSAARGATAISQEKRWFDAVIKGKFDIVREMVEENPDLVNVTNTAQNTALHAAAARGHVDIAQFLISKNADVNAKNRDQKTPLQFAIDKKNEAIAFLLLKNNARYNRGKDDAFITPILSRIRSGESLQADAPAQREEIRTVAASSSRTAQSAAYSSVATTSHTSQSLDMELWEAARDGKLEEVKNLISAGARVNSQHPGNKATPLHMAVINERTPIINYLLQHGADINIQMLGGNMRGQGLTPLDVAKTEEIKDMLQRPFSQRVEVPSAVTRASNMEAQPASNQDPNELLVNAVIEGNVQGIENALAHKAEINHRLFENQSLLMLAASTGNENVFRKLLESGINISLKDDRGDTVEEYIKLAPNKDRLKALLNTAKEQGGRPVSVSASAVESPHRDERVTSATNNADLDHELLMAIEAHNSADGVRNAIENGANVNIQISGETPLHRAAFLGNKNILNILLDNGADPLSENKDGKTPAQLAHDLKHGERRQLYNELQELLSDAAARKIAQQFGSPSLSGVSMGGSHSNRPSSPSRNSRRGR